MPFVQATNRYGRRGRITKTLVLVFANELKKEDRWCSDEKLANHKFSKNGAQDLGYIITRKQERFQEKTKNYFRFFSKKN